MRGLLLSILASFGAIAGPVVIQETLEGDNTNWRFAAARGECTGRWDAENAYPSGHSLRLAISTDATARAHWRYQPRIPLEPNTDYRLSYRLLALNVTGEAYGILYENGEETPDHWHQVPRVTGTHDWQECTISFRTGADASWGMLVLKLRHGTGYAWFDDIVLEKTETAGPQPVADRQFPADDGAVVQAMWSPAQWTQRGVLYLARNQLNPLSLFLRGDPEKLDQPFLVVATTPGLHLEGPLYPGRGPTSDTVAPVASGERQWRFALQPEALRRARLGDRYRWDSYHHLALAVTADAPAEGALTWWFENGGQAGPRHELAVRTQDLGPSLAPDPAFRILIQHTGILRNPRLDLDQGLLAYLQLGAIEGGLAPSHYDPALKPVDLALAQRGFVSHSWRFEGFDAPATAGPRAVGTDGKEIANKLCPSAQLALPSWQESLRDYYRKKLTEGISRLIIDYEPPASTGCFCPVCRRAFAADQGLNPEEILSLEPKEIRERFAAPWAAFCAKRHGDIVRLHLRTIREICPGAEVGLCSWSGTAVAAKGGGDIRQFEPETTCHMPMIYCKGTAYHDQIAETCARTTRPVLPFVELSDISQPRHLTPEDLRMNLLATGLSGGAGAVLWVGAECLDAQYLAQVRQSLRELHELHDRVPWQPEPVSWVTVAPVAELQRTILVDGVPMPVVPDDTHPYLRFHVWGNAQEAAVAVLNYNPDQAYDTVITGPGQNQITLRVPPYELATRIVTRQ